MKERLEAAHFSDDYPLSLSEYRDLCGQALARIEEQDATIAKLEGDLEDERRIKASYWNEARALQGKLDRVIEALGLIAKEDSREPECAKFARYILSDLSTDGGGK